MSVNPKVDSAFGLLDVPGLSSINQRTWKIRLIKIYGRSPALAALSRWNATAPLDFKKIMTAMRLVSGQKSVPALPYIGTTPFSEIYEMRADKGTARLLFFYDRQTNTAVCTKDYEPTVPTNVDTASALSERIREFYLSWSLSLRLS